MQVLLGWFSDMEQNSSSKPERGPIPATAQAWRYSSEIQDLPEQRLELGFMIACMNTLASY